MPYLDAIVPGEPVAQGRPRAFRTPKGHIRTYDPGKSRNWKAEARDHIKAAMVAAGHTVLVSGPLTVRVLAVFTCPLSTWRKKSPHQRRPHAKKPDASNVLKAVEDAATGVVWVDDSQVVRLEIEKVIGAQGEPPYVQLVVERIE